MTPILFCRETPVYHSEGAAGNGQPLTELEVIAVLVRDSGGHFFFVPLNRTTIPIDATAFSASLPSTTTNVYGHVIASAHAKSIATLDRFNDILIAADPQSPLEKASGQ